MNQAENPLAPAAHDAAWALLPWYANGSLGEAERARVRAHLGGCLVCTRELRRLDVLAAAVRAPVDEHACTQAYARLSPRLGRAPRQPRRWLRLPLPMVAGGLLMLCTGGLVTGLVLDGADPVAPSAQSFQTLGRHAPRDARAVAPVLRVVLQDASPAALTAWLARHDAELLDGPSAIGVLTVRVGLTAAGFDARLDALRADATTLFVEPVSSVGARPDRRR